MRKKPLPSSKNPLIRFNLFQTLVQWPGPSLFVSLKLLTNDTPCIKNWSSPFFRVCQEDSGQSESATNNLSEDTGVPVYSCWWCTVRRQDLYSETRETQEKQKGHLYRPSHEESPVQRGAKVLHEIRYFQQKCFEPLLLDQPLKRHCRMFIGDIPNLAKCHPGITRSGWGPCCPHDEHYNSFSPTWAEGHSPTAGYSAL